ncbi:hypothetical protein, partial [Limnohabitans sp. Rim8]|uniref:hypothetical protein n=1 Tax=Limnohabitans sp. Rim8 TaxID=1100718 RepID=UPI0033068B5E
VSFFPGATFTGPNIRHSNSSVTPLAKAKFPSCNFALVGFNAACTVSTLVVDALYGFELVVEQPTNANPRMTNNPVLSNFILFQKKYQANFSAAIVAVSLL